MSVPVAELGGWEWGVEVKGFLGGWMIPGDGWGVEKRILQRLYEMKMK